MRAKWKPDRTFASASGLAQPGLVERDIGASGMAALVAPLGVAMAHEHQCLAVIGHAPTLCRQISGVVNYNDGENSQSASSAVGNSGVL